LILVLPAIWIRVASAWSMISMERKGVLVCANGRGVMIAYAVPAHPESPMALASNLHHGISVVPSEVRLVWL
jgi:hypothetical protein